MLIRDERQLALNDIIAHCREAADLYREAAALTEDETLAGLFAEIGGRRTEMAAGLAPHLRRLGDLPAAPDRDRETVAELATRIKTAWAADERLELLEERQRDEEDLLRLVAAALRQDLPADTRTCLAQMREEIDLTCRRLQQVRARSGAPGAGQDDQRCRK